MVAVPSSHQDRPFPQELNALGAAVQTALRSGGNLPGAISAFCAVAFTRRDLALAGASFLVSTFVRDLKRLGEQMSDRQLADELMAGSGALCSLVSAYWDRKGETGRMVELADELLARGRPAAEYDSQPAEFIAALAASLAIPNPDRARALLQLIEGTAFSREQHALYQEVQEWQVAGQLLSQSSEAERSFWQQEVRRRRRNWFWDTDEGRGAIRKLEEQNPLAASSPSMIHRIVPQWAWEQNRPDDARTVTKTETACETPRRGATPTMAVEPKLSSAAHTRGGASSPVARKPRPIFLAWIGVACLFAAAAGLLFSGGETPKPEVAGPTNLAVVHDMETSAPVVSTTHSVSLGSADVTPSVVTTDATAAVVLPEAEPENEKPAVASAQLVPVELSARNGWVKTPRGAEFQITEANAIAGKVTDPDGRPWQLPVDPVLVAEIAGDREAVNPYSGERVLIAEDKWKPGELIAWGGTGWSFKLPDPLVTAPTEVTKSAPASVSSKDLVQPSVPVSSVKTSEKKRAASGSDDYLASLATKLHPDYSQAPAHSSPDKVRSTTKPKPQPTTSTRSDTHTFVTRANNIRMTYKDGYWESKPGAYLQGSATTPDRWAQDMTLRERSSGTIPSGYVFEVADRGVVRIVPDRAE